MVNDGQYRTLEEEAAEMDGITFEEEAALDDGLIRVFETGATRDTAGDKPDYAGFLHPWVLEAFGKYMQKNQVQSDGTRRASDNWQKGIPKEVYMSSMFRHFMDVWANDRAGLDGMVVTREARHEALCALIFNVMGYLFEDLQGR